MDAKMMLAAALALSILFPAVVMAEDASAEADKEKVEKKDMPPLPKDGKMKGEKGGFKGRGPEDGKGKGEFKGRGPEDGKDKKTPPPPSKDDKDGKEKSEDK